MKTAGTKLLFLSSCLLIFFIGYSQSNWKLAKDQDGIKVYQKDSKGSNFKSIKVECTLDGTYDKLIAVINDIDNYKDWIYNNKNAYLLKRISLTDFYYYTETFLPWPMDNRDAVMHTTITRDSLNRFLKINSVATPNYIPKKSGKIRVPRSDINWYVTSVSANKIRIIYTFDTNPGGSAPSWLVNSFADKGPYESFKNLAETLKKRK